MFIKHLPHGFFEDQLKKYFEQFGEVTRVRLARSKRTGGSKGYAFVEFDYPEVAEVAAETMDNYLMFKKIVKAAYIPPEKQNFNYFRTSVRKIKNKSGKTVWVSSKTASIQRKMKLHNDWSEDNFQKRTKKQLNKIKKLGEKYAHLGIDINNIILEPKTLTEKEKKELQESKAKAEKEEKTAGSSKTLKRKTEKGAEPQKQKKSKKKVSLEDLLGNTIQEDSEDEDYIAMANSDGEDGNQDDESSDEETYGFTKDSDDEEEDASENNDSNDDDEEIAAAPIVKIKSKKSKTTFGKSLKSSNVERFDQMLKRKPQTGGIQKLNKKPTKQPSPINKNKGSLQLTAAKEMAKPLPKVPKGKLGKGAKFNKNIKKVK